MELPLDTSVEAEYADGYIHSESVLNDASTYDDGRNVLSDILRKHPEAEHGPMVRFSVFYKDQRYDVDWRDLPANARPIRFRDGWRTLHADGSETSGWSGCRFGYQYNDATGKSIKEVKEL